MMVMIGRRPRKRLKQKLLERLRRLPQRKLLEAALTMKAQKAAQRMAAVAVAAAVTRMTLKATARPSSASWATSILVRQSYLTRYGGQTFKRERLEELRSRLEQPSSPTLRWRNYAADWSNLLPRH